MTEIKAPGSGSFRPRRRRGRQGFTLTEIMIALGVLAVGMGMAAGAFHAGIQRHIITVDEIRRTMIGENAVAIAKARLRADAALGDAPFQLSKEMLPNGQRFEYTLGQKDLEYPVASGSRFRCLVFGSRPDPERNDFEFMVVIYEVTGTEGQIEVDFRDVRITSILDHPETGKSRAIPKLGVFESLDSKLPIGALLYMSELEDPFVEVEDHLTPKQALLGRHVERRSDVYIPVLTVKINGQIATAALEILGVYRGRTSLQPAEEATDPGQGG